MRVAVRSAVGYILEYYNYLITYIIHYLYLHPDLRLKNVLVDTDNRRRAIDPDRDSWRRNGKEFSLL